jgi:hypothetical protein
MLKEGDFKMIITFWQITVHSGDEIEAITGRIKKYIDACKEYAKDKTELKTGERKLLSQYIRMSDGTCEWLKDVNPEEGR